MVYQMDLGPLRLPGAVDPELPRVPRAMDPGSRGLWGLWTWDPARSPGPWALGMPRVPGTEDLGIPRSRDRRPGDTAFPGRGPGIPWSSWGRDPGNRGHGPRDGSRVKPASFAYHRAGSVPEAVALLAELGD